MIPTPPALHSPAPVSLQERPALNETHARWPFPEALAYLLNARVTGRLTLHPSGVTLHLNAGKVDAVQGVRPLGELLLEQGLVGEDDLTAALMAGEPLGQALLRARKITAVALRAALRQQVRVALPLVLTEVPERYAFTPGQPLPVPAAGVPGGEVLAEALTGGGALPMSSVFQLAPIASGVTVSPEGWALLRWVNGRRPLRRVTHLSGLSTEAAHRAAREIIELELVEQGAVTGLKFIVARMKPASSVRQPPAGIRGNLFIKHLDGTQDVWSVVQKLNFAPEEAASMLCALHRDDLIEVVQGSPEFQRLMEQY